MIEVVMNAAQIQRQPSHTYCKMSSYLEYYATGQTVQMAGLLTCHEDAE